MIREDFFYDSRDNKTKLHAVRWIPENRNPVAIVQIVHGMCEHVDRYEEFAQFLVSKGILVTAEDHLGHGKSVTDGKYGYFCKQDAAKVLVKDVHRLKKLTQGEYPDRPYFILGHSMGSFILRNYLFVYGKGIDGAVVLGTGMPGKSLMLALKVLSSLLCFFGQSQKPSEFINKLGFGAYQKHIQNPRTSYDWLTKEEARVDSYLKDPLCGFVFTANGFKTLADLILTLHKKDNVAKMPVTLPVLFASGSEDPVGDYSQGVKTVYREFINEGMQKVELKIYEGDRHEILNESDKERVYLDIYAFLKKGMGND